MTAPHAVGTDDGPADLAGLARPRRLAHPARLYAVVGGTARPTGQRHFLADLPAGVAVFGMAAPGVTFLLADGRSAARPPAFSDDPIDPAGIEAWHAALLSFVADSQDTVDALADALLLHAGERCAVTAGTRMTARSLTWLQADAPVLRYRGQANGVPLLVVTERVFAEPIADAAVEAIDTAPLVGKVDIAAVAQCSQHLAGRLAGALIGREEVEAERRARIVAIDGAEASRVLRQLREFYRGPPPVPPARPQDSALAHALAAIATVEGFVLRLPPPPPREVALFDRLRDFAGTSGFRFREIALEPGWWREEGPAFLGVEAGAERPLALVWHRGHWRTMGAEGERVVDASVAAALLPRGYLLYPSLPGRIAAGDMLRFALSGVGGEVKRLLLAALATALASLLLPVATGAIVGSAIPQDRPGLLYDMLLLLASAAVGGALFRIVRAFALIRLGTRIDRRLQAAVWDRVIRLPAAFFRGYPTGDLALRVLGVDGIRRILSAATVSAAIGAIFSLISFAVMLFYDARLTAFAAFYAAIAASLMLVIGRRQMVIERDLTQRNGILSGLLVDLLGGMSKVRVAAAELRGFRRWADAYIQQRINIGRGSRQASLQAALASSLPVLGTAGIFLIAAEAGDPVGVGDFAAFIGAFGQFTEAMMGLSAAVNVGVEVIPLYARLRPVLDAPLEAAEDRIDPGTLGGRIGIAIDRRIGVGVALAGARVEVGVGAQPLMHAAAEQGMDGFAERLAVDIPQRHLDPGQHPHQRDIRPHRVAAAIHVAPQRLDVERIAALDMLLEHVLDHLHHNGGGEAGGIDLADALDAVVGDQLEEDEIAAAIERRRVADDEGLEALDFHCGNPNGGRGGR